MDAPVHFLDIFKTLDIIQQSEESLSLNVGLLSLVQHCLQLRRITKYHFQSKAGSQCKRGCKQVNELLKQSQTFSPLGKVATTLFDRYQLSCILIHKYKTSETEVQALNGNITASGVVTFLLEFFRFLSIRIYFYFNV